MITQQELKNHITYNKSTGEFFNKKTGKIATYRQNTKSGVRLRIHINGTNYYASRLAILYVTGKYPDGFVRFWNGDSTDLRWKNLVFKEQEFIPKINEDTAAKEVIELSPLQRLWRWING